MKYFPQQQLAAALERVVTSPISDFYRNLIGDFDLTEPVTPESWQRVPFVTREIIQGSTFWKRAYVAPRDIHFVRHTSGSSGARIMITPRITFGDYDTPITKTGATRLLYFNFPAYHEFPREETGIVTVIGDAGNLPVSARLARLANVDAIYMTPQTALVFADLLEAEGALNNIRVVIISGERCSPLQLRKLRERYIGAIFTNLYGTSEGREVIAFTCEHMWSKNALQLQPAPEFYCEIIDPETGEVIDELGRYGELVVTSLTEVPFPMIRYRSGDVALFVKRDCACDAEQWGIEVIGRQTIFPVRITKGEITVDACEIALQKVLGSVPYFELHYREGEVSKSALPQLHVVFVGEGNTEEFARKLEGEIFINPKYSYAQGVSDKLYLPLTVALMETAPKSPVGKPKAPVLVRHYN